MRRATAISFIGLVPALFVALSSFGCATDEAQKKDERMIWPLPPEPTRIRYLQKYESSEDVLGEQSFFDKIVEAFAGEREVTKFRKPHGIHVDARGRLFISDTGQAKVLVFDPDNKSFEAWGESGPGVLSRPINITSDKAGNIYVSDAVSARVVCYKPDGSFLRAYGREGELIRPVGIGVNDASGELFVTDTKLHKLVVFDLETAENLRAMGRQGNKDGEFNFPTNLAIGPDGRVYVADAMNFRVQIFNPDGSFRSKFGCHSTNIGCFSRMKGIGVNSEGHIYVVDAAFNVVQIFDDQGRTLLFFGGPGHKEGQLWLPSGIDIDDKNQIYVVDQFNWRVNVYEYVDQPDSANDKPVTVDEEKPTAKAADEEAKPAAAAVEERPADDAPPPEEVAPADAPELSPDQDGTSTPTEKESDADSSTT